MSRLSLTLAHCHPVSAPSLSNACMHRHDSTSTESWSVTAYLTNRTSLHQAVSILSIAQQ